MATKKTITKSEIIHELMATCGLSYVMAAKAYSCFSTIIETSVTDMRKMTLGRVGTLVPKVIPAKTVSMNCSRTRKGVHKVQKYYFLDSRVKVSLRLYKSFLKTAEFNPPSPDTAL